MNRKRISFIVFFIVFNLISSQEKWSDTLLISNNASNRATHYLESNKIIENDSIIITTILEFNKNKYYNSLYKVNKKTKKTSKFKFDVTHKDNHSGAAIAVDSLGYIYVVLGGHHSSIKTYLSKTPWEINDFELLSSLEGKYTYPCLVIDKNNNIPFLSLRQTKKDNNWTLSFFVLNNKKWKFVSEPIIGNYKKWLKEANPSTMNHTRGYQNFSSTFQFDKNNRIHLLYRIYEYAPSDFNICSDAMNPYQKFGVSYLIGYTYSDDFGNTWNSNNGINIKQISPKEAIIIKGNTSPEKIMSYFEISNLILWEDRIPMFLFVERVKDNHKLFICKIDKNNGFSFKKIKAPLNYLAFYKPRIATNKNNIFFVTSVMRKDQYNRKDTWGGKNNLNFYGTIDPVKLKIKITDIINIKPSWTATIPYYAVSDLKKHLPVLVNKGFLESERGEVFLFY
ncbi:BNR-4 repeat-containing protein [Aquimarina sp. LLG6339-5]|uniref:BNR-4 repeat-containing protein n=1 Tax=Aquimarina sp. LLG6339-5 TaxID=3160830 RepID=UPI00386D4665